MGRTREGEDLWDPQEMIKGEQRRLPRFFYCRVADATGKLDLEEEKKRKRERRSMGSFSGFSGRCGLWVSKGCMLNLGTGKMQEVIRGRLEGKDLWHP